MHQSDIVRKLINVYEWLNKIADPGVAITVQELEKLFTADFILRINSQNISYDYPSFQKYFGELRQNGSTYKIHLPFEEIIISEDRRKVVATYKVSIIDSHKIPHPMDVMAIGHFSESGLLKCLTKIAYIEEVSLIKFI